MTHRNNPFKKSVGFYQVSMATSLPYTTSTSGNNERAYAPTKKMETYPQKGSRTSSHSGKSSPKGVNFENTKEKTVERKEKYLTAKYGAHQMMLIKKRLKVEMWVFEELSRLYCTEDDDHDCKLELEEVLNLDTDDDRREYILEQLVNAKESPEEIHKFVEELIQKARTL